jgi:hypothetical protein
MFRGTSVVDNKYVFGKYSSCDEPGDNGLNGHQFRETTTKLCYITDDNDELHAVYCHTVIKIDPFAVPF